MTLQEIIDSSDNIVFFGGAGVSTESGIPDFRSVDGLYNMKYDYPPETILSHTFFMNNTEKGKLKAVITQNIDGLHQMAGSKNVLELHGSTLRNYCMDCGKSYDIDYIENSKGVPKCECGGIIKPDVVLYEEMLNDDTITKSVQYISNADVLIIGGTSLNVYPAAGFINYFRGSKLVIINKAATSADKNADLVISEPIGEVLGSLKI